jgi:hypothetical protein
VVGGRGGDARSDLTANPLAGSSLLTVESEAWGGTGGSGARGGDASAAAAGGGFIHATARGGRGGDGGATGGAGGAGLIDRVGGPQVYGNAFGGDGGNGLVDGGAGGAASIDSGALGAGQSTAYEDGHATGGNGGKGLGGLGGAGGFARSASDGSGAQAYATAQGGAGGDGLIGGDGADAEAEANIASFGGLTITSQATGGRAGQGTTESGAAGSARSYSFGTGQSDGGVYVAAYSTGGAIAVPLGGSSGALGSGLSVARGESTDSGAVYVLSQAQGGSANRLQTNSLLPVASGAATAVGEAVGHGHVQVYALASGSGDIAVAPALSFGDRSALAHVSGSDGFANALAVTTRDTTQITAVEKLTANALRAVPSDAFEAYAFARTGGLPDTVPTSSHNVASGILNPVQSEIDASVGGNPFVAGSLATNAGAVPLVGSLSAANAGCGADATCTTTVDLTVEFDYAPSSPSFALGLLGAELLAQGDDALRFRVTDSASMREFSFSDASAAAAFFADHVLPLTLAPNYSGTRSSC